MDILCFEKFYHPFHFMFDIYTTNLLRHEQVCLLMFNESLVGVLPSAKNLLIHPVPTKFLFPPTKSQFNPIKK